MIKNLDNIKTMNSLWQKTIGVIGKKKWGQEKGYFFPGVTSIHTFFVSLTLDLVFVDEEMKIVKIIKSLKPFRVSPIVWNAKSVFELSEGSIEKLGLKVGDKIKIV